MYCLVQKVDSLYYATTVFGALPSILTEASSQVIVEPESQPVSISDEYFLETMRGSYDYFTGTQKAPPTPGQTTGAGGD